MKTQIAQVSVAPSSLRTPMLNTRDSTSPIGAKESDAPEGWEQVQLGELADVKGGKRLPKGSTFAKAPSPRPYIRVTDFENWTVNTSDLRYLRNEDCEAIARYIIRKEDVYISIAGTIGLVGTVPEQLDGANLTENAARLVITDPSAVVRDYLISYLASPRGQREIEARTVRTSQPKLALARIKTIPVLLPPFPEQRAIAGVLRTMQEAQEVCEKVLAATRQLKQSLLRHLFTYGSVPFAEAAHVPLQETEIGPMPATWRVARIGELGEVITGTTPSTKRPDFYGGPFMFIAPGDIGSGKYIALAEKHLTATGLAECRSLPRASVVVVCIGATIGKVGLTVENSGATNQQCNSVIPNDGVLAEFLFYAMSLRAQALPLLAGRAAIPIVNKSNFCDFRVPVAPLPEQREIAAQLSALDAKLAAEESRRAALAALFQSLLHHLMTGRVRLPEFVKTKA